MESDLSLINKIKDFNDDSCLVELIHRHSGIYVYIVDQYTKSPQASSSRANILEDKDYVIYKSALDYDPSKNSKFSTYLANQTKWKCLNAINKSKKHKEVSIDAIYNKPSDQDNSYETLSKIEAFELFNKMLKEENDARVKKIIDIRYNTTNTRLVPWRKASLELKMSIQGCINIHDRFIDKVKKQLDKKYV
tara:strand:- start:5607 stop:6182 length:576 start_codon:yes stop_codon:yes gene_type:complete